MTMATVARTTKRRVVEATNQPLCRQSDLSRVFVSDVQDVSSWHVFKASVEFVCGCGCHPSSLLSFSSRFVFFGTSVRFPKLAELRLVSQSSIRVSIVANVSFKLDARNSKI